ncbi:hypothetical protein PNA2_1928 [Pyrococcus sp. NA2]|uniref:hypothetical protein n=1 Tax=Pyrococcus sp. (strain NA2) TaxID=342949 RepID=UPI000209AD94|nr:hypothetical protein [Pyrococcus sp. NA2]AEC52842.1 hypothetical protein PNA2_1928 [Pyrococcus sp. NA2]
MRITKRNVFWTFVMIIWMFNFLVLLSILGLIEIEGLIFYLLATIPPLFFYLYVMASPPEPDFMRIVKFGWGSVAVYLILVALNALLT